jgi:hypothetical protein
MVPILTSAVFAGIAGYPANVLACAACYGQSDSAMAQGFNWGIFSLLAVIVSVLITIAGFFFFLARRSASLATGVVLRSNAVSPLNSQHPTLTAH